MILLWREKHTGVLNSTVSFDQKRAKNNEKGYAAGTLFNLKTGYRCFR